jgi:hypothetical protein
VKAGQGDSGVVGTFEHGFSQILTASKIDTQHAADFEERFEAVVHMSG